MSRRDKQKKPQLKIVFSTLVLLVIVFLLSYYKNISSRKNDNSQLPTNVDMSTNRYVNDQFNFELLIPIGWEVREDNTGYVEADKSVVQSLQIAPKFFKEGYYSRIDIRGDGVESSAQSIIELNEEHNQYLREMNVDESKSFISNKDSEFNGYSARVITFSTGAKQEKYFLIKQGGNTYVLFVNDETINEEYKIASQVISTFRFIK